MVRYNDIIRRQKSYLIYRFTWILPWTSKIDDSLLKLWFSCKKIVLPFEGFLCLSGLLVLPWAPLGVNPPSMPSSIIHPCNLSFVLGVGHCKLPSRWCSGRDFIGDSTISWSFVFFFVEAVGSEPDEFHHRFSTMILGYFSMIVEEKRNGLYAYWHFHRSAKSLRAFGWFVGGASCAFCFSGSTGPNFAGGSGDGESHSHLQKKEVWISEKHYREQEKCVWFVRSDVREDRQSMVLFPAKHIHTSLKEACLFWQSDDADSAKQCFFLNMASFWDVHQWTSCIFQLQDLQIDHQRCADAHCPSKAKMSMSFCSVAVLTCMLSLF